MIERHPSSPEEALYNVYGRKPPVQFLGRLKTEEYLVKNSFFDDLYLVEELQYYAEDDGTEINVECNYGASLLNWLYDCTRINPLPPHYYCETCKRTLTGFQGDGWDLPPLECCGKPMVRDGHSIPIEVMLRRLEDPKCGLEIRIAKSFSDKAVEIIKKYYKRMKIAVVSFETEEDENDDIKFVLIPKDKAIPAMDENGVWHTDWDELFHSKFRRITLYSRDIKEQLRNFRKKTGLNPTVDDLLTVPVMATTQAKLTAKIVEEGGTPLKADDPAFSSLLKTIGYLKSSHSAANPMLTEKEARYSDVFTCREEVFDLLHDALKPEYGISMEFVKKVTWKTRSGQYTRNRMEQGTERVLRGIGISDHWITQMKETSFLRGKSDLINYLLEELELTWFELQEEKESEAATESGI